MPKTNSLISMWIKEYPELILIDDNVFCTHCSKKIHCDKKFQITQHVGTNLHKRNCKSTTQLTLSQSFASTSKHVEKESFRFDLCNTLMSSNIPLAKLDNPTFTSFLEKYTKMEIPSRTTLMRTYVEKVFESTMSKIKEIIGDNHIYIVVDETTDSTGRYIANLLIGTLNEHFSSKSYLIGVQKLDRVNNVSVSKFINDVLIKFYLPKAVPSDKVLLMLTDGATYMVKSAQNLKMFYNNLIHVTCLAHGVNRIAEEIRNTFPDINNLVNTTKKIFVKAPLRIDHYKNILPGLPLPPQPVITRWDTWLNAAAFYTDNFEGIKKVVNSFSSEDSIAIRDCKLILSNTSTLPQNLAFVKANYSFICELLNKLETQCLELTESIQMIETFKRRINSIEGSIAQNIKKKLENLLRKNEGFNFLQKISNILQGNVEEGVQLDPSLISKLKYAPITSVDVERSFSSYKQILTDRRHSFLLKNLEKHLIVNILCSITNKEI